MTVTFTTSLSYEEYLAANRLMIRRRWYGRGMLRFVLIVTAIYAALGFGIFLIADGRLEPWTMVQILAGSFACAVVLAIFVSLVSWWRLPRTCRKMWAQQHIEGLPTVHEYDAQGIRIANARGSNDLDWTMFSGWIEDDRLFMMFRTAMTFHAVPKAQVAQEHLTALRDSLRAAGIPPRC